MSGQRIPAANLEDLVVQRLRSFFAGAAALHDALPPHKCDAPCQKRANESAAKISQALAQSGKMRGGRSRARSLRASKFTSIGSTLT